MVKGKSLHQSCNSLRCVSLYPLDWRTRALWRNEDSPAHTHTFLQHIWCSTHAVLSISYLFTGSQYAGKFSDFMWAAITHTHRLGLNWCWIARRPWPGYNLTDVAVWVNILRTSWVTRTAVIQSNTGGQHKSNKTVLTGVGVLLWLHRWENRLLIEPYEPEYTSLPFI